jgi:transcriptional regulator with XRE-family HTH domain
MSVITTPSPLREAREKAGLTQEELALRANTYQEAIARVETGQRNLGIKLAMRVATVLDADPLVLMGVKCA